MKVAITGGTGFVGRHLARRISEAGHQALLVARGCDERDTSVRSLPGIEFVASDLTDADVLAAAFAGCDALVHAAGINRETGRQTYRRVHVEGTRNVVEAARRSGVRRVILLSFLRARPGCGSAYHESKWEAEELVRSSGLDYTVLKVGMTYGRGDHMLDHLSHAIHTFPVFATVGLREVPIRPVAIDDVIDILMAALDGRLSRETVAVTGPDPLLLSDAVRRVAEVLGRRVWILPAPVFFHALLAFVFERTMKVPLIAKAQVRILTEGFDEPGPLAGALPADLLPRRRFTASEIAGRLPPPRAFGLHDLRCRTLSEPPLGR